jgi:uncharacterized protein (TIGR02646 family)
MRPVDRGPAPTRTVKEHGEYADDLLDRLDAYCSYCELRLSHAVEVEHVQPKSLRDDLRLEWSNLLLACKYCNAPKQATNVDRDRKSDWYWPDRDNTFKAFTYEDGGVVGLAPGLTEEEKLRAGRLRSLVKLNRPNDTQAQHRRWRDRRDAWKQIADARRDFDEVAESERDRLRGRIVAEARALGFWSRWMTVFADDQDLRLRFICAFRGTAADCFDASGNPITGPRPGGDL